MFVKIVSKNSKSTWLVFYANHFVFQAFFMNSYWIYNKNKDGDIYFFLFQLNNMYTFSNKKNKLSV